MEKRALIVVLFNLQTKQRAYFLMNTGQDVFTMFYPQYKEKYKPSMEQAKVTKDIMSCRTATLGEHAYTTYF
jgi:hypothetical protein